MFALKGFISSAAFVDNNPGVTAKIGELSTQSATYSLHKGQYTSASIKDLTLTSFLSEQDGVRMAVPVELVTHVLTIAQYVFNKTLTSSGEIYADELLQDLLSKFAANANTFACGEIITDGHYYVPEWLSWLPVNVGSVAAGEVRIWFVDDSFKLQYDEYEIVVVPPIDNLDNFFKTGEEVQQMLAAITQADMAKRMQAAKNEQPETLFDAVMYNYVDRYNAANQYASYWGILGYGAASNNVDFQRDALTEFILANSTYSRDDWTKIFPDIFKRTEVIMVPSWYQSAVPDREVQAGIYSPVMKLTDSLAKLKGLVPSYPADHINSHAATMGHPYKSLSIMTVGGPDNRSELFEIIQLFPDYISVGTNSTDFNRMAQTTKDWLNMIADMLPVAEAMSAFSSIPLGMSRTTRDGVLYLVKSFNNINYLIAAKSNFALS
jgi:hypothetical protein